MSINTCICNGNSIVVKNRKIYINGIEVDNKPVRKSNNQVMTTTPNGKLYINCYEYKNGKWKITLPAIINYFL